MPYELAWDRQAVTVRFSGHLTCLEFLDGARVVGEDPRFDDLRVIVNDFGAVDSHELSVEVVLDSLAGMSLGAAVTNPDIRVAVIACDLKIRELARAFVGLVGTDGPEVTVLDDGECISGWLSQPPGPRRLRPRG